MSEPPDVAEYYIATGDYGLSRRELLSMVPAAHLVLWDREKRGLRWQLVVARLHSADAVDNHCLSWADCERLASAALDEAEMRRHE